MTDSGVLLRNRRGRIRCYWNREEPDECSDDGWSMFREYFIDEDGYVALCYNHSDEPRKAYIMESRRRAAAIREETRGGRRPVDAAVKEDT